VVQYASYRNDLGHIFISIVQIFNFFIS